VEKVKAILDHGHKNHVVFDVNEEYIFEKHQKKIKGNLLIAALYTVNRAMIQLLLEYAEQHHMLLEINKNFTPKCHHHHHHHYHELKQEGNSLFFALILSKNIDIVKLLLDYAERHQMTFEVNNKFIMENATGKIEGNALIAAICTENLEMIKLGMDYAENHHVLFEINEKFILEDYKTKIMGNSLIVAISSNNLDIIQLLIAYADRHNLLFELNEKFIIENEEGTIEGNALIAAILTHHREIIQEVLAYADRHQVVLELREGEMEKEIPYLDREIIKLLKDGKVSGKIKVDFSSSDHSKLQEKFNEVN